MTDNADAMKAVQDNLNGAGVLQGNPEVIGLLRELLRGAEAGEVTGVAVAMCVGANGIGARSAGGNPGALVLGLEHLKGMITDNAFAPKRGGSGLLVPGRRM